MHRPRPHVLVVDDDCDARFELAEWLTNGGFRSLLAADTDVAFRLVRCASPDVVIVNDGVPGSGALVRFLSNAIEPVALIVITRDARAVAAPADSENSATISIARPTSAVALVTAVRCAIEWRADVE